MSVFILPTWSAAADPVQIVRYDITNALVSGYGGWAHVYTGTITPTSTFDISEVLATYAGGGGTLNNGAIENSVSDTQLFDARANPIITVFLSSPVRLKAIDLFGGNIPLNSAPGSLIGTVAVFANGIAALVPTLPFGHQLADNTQPVNDRLLLNATALDGVVTDRIVLSGFRSSVDTFSLAEISVNGPNPVPEPSTLVLLASGLVAARLRRRHA